MISWCGPFRQDALADRPDALGAPQLPTSHGRSILPLLSSPNASWDDLAFSEYCTDEGQLHRMIRRCPWKLNYYHGQEPQLFHLEADPEELHDLARADSYHEVR